MKPTTTSKGMSEETKQQECGSSSVVDVVPRHYEFKHSFFARVPWEFDDVELIHLHCQAFQKQFSLFTTEQRSKFEHYRVQCFKALIFFSNQIEDVGLCQSDTYKLLDDILQGASIPPEQLDVTKNDLPNRRPRKEVIQHAQAYQFLCVENLQEPLTADILKRTHFILMKDMPSPDGCTLVPGEYRQHPSNAGFHQFLAHRAIPYAVQNMLAVFRRYEDEHRDPFSISAFLCYQFVAIHPFSDGNGRMCRLLLNYALLRAGIPFPIPVGFPHRNARSRYLKCLRLADEHEEPKHLSTLIISSVRRTWRNIFQNLKMEGVSVEMH